MTATDDRVWSRPLVAAPTVLVVDDDDYVRTTIERMLTSLGAPAVHQASSAARALEMASYLAPEIDVVVTDLEMPGIDGMEFLRRLSEQWARASVLIISGKDEGILRSVELMAREYGLDVLGVLPKPATMGALREALSRHSRVLTSEAPAAAQASVTPHEIAGAIDRGEFVLFYQPKVQLATGQVSGAEGLVRWRHADRGLLLPGHFIGVAEQHGLLDRLTLVLFEAAARTVQAWRSAGLDVPVSLNVSQTTLADTTFASRVIDLFSREGLAPSRLVVEVTETVAMTDVAHCLETLVRLRMHGVGLSIDDFGTGHASFQQLSRVPYTELKIDRGFVSGVSTQARLRTIVESSVNIARQLGLTCAAEGVTTRADWDFLRRVGCEAAQGYFVARPMEAVRLPDWAHRWNAHGVWSD